MDELRSLASFKRPLPNPVRPVRHHICLPSQASAVRRRPTRLCHCRAGRVAIGRGTGEHSPQCLRFCLVDTHQREEVEAQRQNYCIPPVWLPITHIVGLI